MDEKTKAWVKAMEFLHGHPDCEYDDGGCVRHAGGRWQTEAACTLVPRSTVEAVEVIRALVALFRVEIADPPSGK